MKRINILGISLFIFCLLFFSGCTQPESEGDEDFFDEAFPQEGTRRLEDRYMWSEMTHGPYHDKISYARSEDLLHWVDSEETLMEHASVPGALYKDGVIYMYFVDVSEDGIAERTGLIRSEDNGETWLDKQWISFEGIGNKVPVDPAPFLLDDGRIRMYYFDINEARAPAGHLSVNKIYSAISTDGIYFVHEEGVRFSRQDVFDPVVIYEQGLWRMYVGDITNNQVICATSSDGLTFIEEGIALTGGAIPEVVFKEDTYYLFTGGIDISLSIDGVHFTKTDHLFRSNLGMITADPSVIELNDGTYLMFYKYK